MLYTSTYKYNGNFKQLDITTTTKDPIAIYFIPTLDITLRYKRKQISQEQYIQEYNYIINSNFKYYPNIFDELANIIFKDNIVFTCYCPANTFCHRLILKDRFIQSKRYIDKYSEPLQYGGEI